MLKSQNRTGTGALNSPPIEKSLWSESKKTEEDLNLCRKLKLCERERKPRGNILSSTV